MKGKKTEQLRVVAGVQLNIADKILLYYKHGAEYYLTDDEENIRKRIDMAAELMRSHSYDRELVRGMLVQKYDVTHETAKNYILWGQTIHAAFMAININYELLWQYEDLKKRILAAKPDDKSYAKMKAEAREYLKEIDKKQAQQPKQQGTNKVIVKFSPDQLGLPADFDKENEMKLINELKRKAKKKITGIEDAITVE